MKEILNELWGKEQEHPTEVLKEGQKNHPNSLPKWESGDVQKWISVEKMGFDDCQAPWEEGRNYKLPRKHHRPRLAEAEASQESVARSYCWVCLNCRHTQLQREAVSSQGYAIWETAMGNYLKDCQEKLTKYYTNWPSDQKYFLYKIASLMRISC